MTAKALLFLLVLPPLVAGCSSADDRAAAADARYEALLSGGNVVGARDAAAEAAQARDDVPELWLKLGRTEAALGRFGAARAAYERALELDQASAEALQALADIAVLAGEHDRALEYADQMLLIGPDDPRATVVQGVVALRRRRPEEALARAEQVLAQDAANEAALVLRARAVHARGRSQQAAEQLEDAVRVHGATPSKLQALTDIYRDVGDLPKLRETHGRLVRLAPDNQVLRFAQARDLYRTGDKEGGHQVIDALRRAHPGDQTLPARITALWRSAARPGAIGEADIRRFAADASPAMRVALARYALGSDVPVLAAELLSPYVGGRITAGNATAHALFGAALYRQGDHSRASRLAEQVVAFDKAHPDALRLRAEAALARGDHRRALVDAQVLVRDQPRAAENHLLLARAHAAAGAMPLAMLTMKEAAKEFPRHPGVAAEYAKLRAAAAAAAAAERGRKG